MTDDRSRPMTDNGADPLPEMLRVVRAEAAAVAGLAALLDEQSAAASAICTEIAARTGEGRPGRLVLTGVGKAGLIARKVSATCASTGTPSFFLHPTEARHGDLGMVQAADLVLALSNSGASEELVALLPSLRRIGCPLYVITGDPASPLATHADQVLGIGRLVEACPLGLAPSSSTTAMLALGDALALAVQSLRGLTPEDYARYHPGGALGRKLMTCAEAMRPLDRVALVDPTMPVQDVLSAITKARAGCALLVDAGRRLHGLFTDGDLRRALTRHPAAQVLPAPVRSHATCPCTSIAQDQLLAAALRLCAVKHIDELPVVDAAGCVAGLLDLQDLADRGYAVG